MIINSIILEGKIMKNRIMKCFVAVGFCSLVWGIVLFWKGALSIKMDVVEILLTAFFMGVVTSGLLWAVARTSSASQEIEDMNMAEWIKFLFDGSLGFLKTILIIGSIIVTFVAIIWIIKYIWVHLPV